MNLLFDTNIILSIVRSNDSPGLIRLLNPQSASVFISIASLAETKSIARQKSWGSNKQKRLNDFLEQVNTIDIDNLSMNTYAEIDSFSQLQNPDFRDYSFRTPRNMGKNDLDCIIGFNVKSAAYNHRRGFRSFKWCLFRSKEN